MIGVADLREHRISRGLRVPEICNRLKITRAAYYLYEKKNCVPVTTLPIFVEMMGEGILTKSTTEDILYTGYMLQINCIYHNVSLATIADILGLNVSNVRRYCNDKGVNLAWMFKKIGYLFDPLIYPCVMVDNDAKADSVRMDLLGDNKSLKAITCFDIPSSMRRTRRQSKTNPVEKC